jgi:hypothetical protein
MAKLTQAAVKMLEDAGCNEISDDLIVIATTDVRVLLSHRAIANPNEQAREWGSTTRLTTEKPGAPGKREGIDEIAGCRNSHHMGGLPRGFCAVCVSLSLERNVTVWTPPAAKTDRRTEQPALRCQ